MPALEKEKHAPFTAVKNKRFDHSPGSAVFQYGDDDRTLPIRLRASRATDQTSFYLPQGFELDSKLEDFRIDKNFGRYESTTTIENGKLISKRTFEIQDTVVPADRYKEQKDFYAAVINAENFSVVLKKR